jgi:hypothetical protein
MPTASHTSRREIALFRAGEGHASVLPTISCLISRHFRFHANAFLDLSFLRKLRQESVGQAARSHRRDAAVASDKTFA